LQITNRAIRRIRERMLAPEKHSRVTSPSADRGKITSQRLCSSGAFPLGVVTPQVRNCSQTVLRDELGDAVTALASAPRASTRSMCRLASDIGEGEISAPGQAASLVASYSFGIVCATDSFGTRARSVTSIMAHASSVSIASTVKIMLSRVLAGSPLEPRAMC
jgi:hypothetical protein